MIPANKYCFVNVNGNFIRNSSTGVSTTSSVPTYETAAFIREIYRTAKAWSGYSIGEYRDSWPTKPYVLDEVPMWCNSDYSSKKYNEIREQLNLAGKRLYGSSSSSDYKNLYRGNQSYTGGATITDSEVVGHLMKDVPSPNMPSSIDSMSQRVEQIDCWQYALSVLSNDNRDDDLRYFWNLSWHYDLYGTSGGFEDWFDMRSVNWCKDGLSYSGDLPQAFTQFGRGESGTPPCQFYYKITGSPNGNRDGIFSKEGSWFYTFNAPTWTTQRYSDYTRIRIFNFIPVYKIAFTRTWIGYNGDGTIGASDWDARYYDIYFIPSISSRYGDFFVNDIPYNGGDCDIFANAYDNVKSIGDSILRDSGVLKYPETRPWHDSSSYRWVCEGYEAVIKVAGVLMTMNHHCRNFDRDR